MEVAGVALGVAGLAGLFSACLDCYQLIRRGAAMDKDYKILEAKFNNQELRLSSWGRACGLLDPYQYDTRLDEPELRTRIIITLECIKTLFEDEQVLRERYGLTARQQALLSGPPAPRLLPFKPLVRGVAAKLPLGLFFRRKKLQRSPDILDAALWAISDRTKFADLVQNLRDFNDDLEAMTQATNIPRRQRVIVEYEIQEIDDVETLEEIALASQDGSDVVSDTASMRLGRIREGSLRSFSIRTAERSSDSASFVTARSTFSISIDAVLGDAMRAWRIPAETSQTPYSDSMIVEWTDGQPLVKRRFRDSIIPHVRTRYRDVPSRLSNETNSRWWPNRALDEELPIPPTDSWVLKLNVLPQELWTQILGRLLVPDIFNLRAVSWEWHRFISSYQESITYQFLNFHHSYIPPFVTRIFPPDVMGLKYLSELWHRLSATTILAQQIIEWLKGERVALWMERLPPPRVAHKVQLMFCRLVPLLFAIFQLLETMRATLVVNASVDPLNLGLGPDIRALAARKFGYSASKIIDTFSLLMRFLDRQLRPPTYLSGVEKFVLGYSKDPPLESIRLALVFFGGVGQISRIVRIKTYKERVYAVEKWYATAMSEDQPGPSQMRPGSAEAGRDWPHAAIAIPMRSLPPEDIETLLSDGSPLWNFWREVSNIATGRYPESYLAYEDDDTGDGEFYGC